MVAVTHAIIDVGKFDIWARPFIWIGMNPITLYMLANLIDGGYEGITQRLLHGDIQAAMGGNASLVMATVGALVPVWLAWVLHKNKCFLRV